MVAVPRREEVAAAGATTRHFGRRPDPAVITATTGTTRRRPR